MKTIPRQIITDTWDRLCELDEEEVNTLVKDFMEEQPALGIYLFANAEDLEGGVQNSPIIDLVVASWQTLRAQAARPLKPVPPEQIERAEDANHQYLEKLQEASEAEWDDSVRNLAEGYNQRELLGFGIEILMSGHEESPELAPDSIGMELLWLKTVIDCLDQ